MGEGAGPIHRGAGNAEAPAISHEVFEALAEMIGLDMPEVLIDIVDTYLEESATLVEAVQTAHAQNRRDEMLRPVHSLKSSSASLGAMHLSQLCAHLEDHLRGYGEPLDVDAQVTQIVREQERAQAALRAERRRLLRE